MPHTINHDELERMRAEQMRRYRNHLETARTCREKAMRSGITEYERRRLMGAHDDALRRAYHEVA